MPPMYIDGFGRRITAQELSVYSGGLHWAGDRSEEDLAREGIWHEPLENLEDDSCVGEGAATVARELADALAGATLPAGESDTTGRIVVFADDGGGFPSVAACSEALGLKMRIEEDDLDVRAEASVTLRNWESRLEHGFCHEVDEEDLEFEEDDENHARIVRATTIMNHELEDHFEFNMSHRVVCAPVLYGGRCGNAIVAVLGMRVWT